MYLQNPKYCEEIQTTLEFCECVWPTTTHFSLTFTLETTSSGSEAESIYHGAHLRMSMFC